MLHKASQTYYVSFNDVTEYGHEIWNLERKSLYWAGSLKTVSTELVKYKFNLMWVQEVSIRVKSSIQKDMLNIT